jgi:hypothetical protein
MADACLCPEVDEGPFISFASEYFSNIETYYIEKIGLGGTVL